MPRGRAWTEEETALVYWALPLMRVLGRITEREFSAIAMKLANLLAVETHNREGLANSSSLDRAIVKRYAEDREALERHVVSLVVAGATEKDRRQEIREAAVDVLRSHGVPLNVELIGLIVVSRNPLLVASRSLLLDALRTSTRVMETEEFVFTIRRRAS
jgi:hypothetical protein